MTPGSTNTCWVDLKSGREASEEDVNTRGRNGEKIVGGLDRLRVDVFSFMLGNHGELDHLPSRHTSLPLSSLPPL